MRAKYLVSGPNDLNVKWGLTWDHKHFIMIVSTHKKWAEEVFSYVESVWDVDVSSNKIISETITGWRYRKSYSVGIDGWHDGLSYMKKSCGWERVESFRRFTR